MKIDSYKAESIIILLRNLSAENTGWRRFFSRWLISDEPLRGDAKAILEWIERDQ